MPTIENSYGSTVYGRTIDTDDGGKILQYHFFYLENDWRRGKGAGAEDGVVEDGIGTAINGLHESDWEFMQIKLGADLLPQEFMASTHLYEASYRNPFDTDLTAEGNHINAFVTHGGHGTYFTEGEESFSSYNGIDARIGGELGLYSKDSFSSLTGFSETKAYNLVEITNDSPEYKWLSASADKDGNEIPLIEFWGKPYNATTGISNPPGSPVFNGDGRWDDPDNWLGADLEGALSVGPLFYPVDEHKVLVDNGVENHKKPGIYEIINATTGEVKLAGLESGQMEMGFLFDGTDLQDLGHFDLV